MGEPPSRRRLPKCATAASIASTCSGSERPNSATNLATSSSDRSGAATPATPLLPNAAVRIDQFRNHDDRCLLFNGFLRVVAGVEAPAGALRDAAVRVGEVVLRRGFGHTDLTLVASTLGLAIVVSRLAFVLGLTQAEPKREDGSRSSLTPWLPASRLADCQWPSLVAVMARQGCALYAQSSCYRRHSLE